VAEHLVRNGTRVPNYQACAQVHAIGEGTRKHNDRNQMVGC
jgi:hypothetical protein